MVQELITNFGSITDGRIAFLMEPTGTEERRALTWDESGVAEAPRIHIEWSVPTSNLNFVWSGGNTLDSNRATIGEHIVTVSDQLGCDSSSDTVNMERRNYGTVGKYILNVDTITFCPGDSTRLWVVREGTIDTRITTSEQDAFQSGGGSVNLTQADIDIGEEGYGGFKFTGINLPEDAIISSAYIELTSKNDDTNVPSEVKIFGENSAAPLDYVNVDFDISSRAKTVEEVTWSMGVWDADSVYQTPDLSAIITEVLNSRGGLYDGALNFVFQAISSEKREPFSADEGIDSLAPRLVINWTSPANSFVWNTGQTTDTIQVDSIWDYFVLGTNALGCTDTSMTARVEISSNFGLAIEATDTVTCAGTPITFTPLITQGTCLYFDADKHKLELTNDAHLNPDFITVEAWIKADTFLPFSFAGTVVANSEVKTNPNEAMGYDLRVGGDGIASFEVGLVGRNSFTEAVSPDFAVTLDTWHHLAGTYDGTFVRIYVDGVQVGQTARPGGH